MKYLIACVLAFAVSGCAEHRELTACQGPYNTLTPPPPALPKAALAGQAQVQAVR